jgi:hypothetical protein
MCAAVAATLGMFGTATQATFYGGDFDPPTIQGHFTGHFLLNVSDSCNSEDCQIDVVSLLIDASSTFGPGWVSDGQTDIATNVNFDGHLIAFDSVLVGLFIPSFEGPSQFTASVIPCTPSLRFTSVFDTDFLGHEGFIADMECVNANQQNVGDNATYVLRQIPEPGTLALILGGIGAGWLTRRRKAAS